MSEFYSYKYFLYNEFVNWDPDKFDWKYNSYYLVQYCHEYFDKWWDTNKFNWEHSDYLAEYCNKHFDKWWNPNKYNWEDGSYYIALYCYDHFNKWWDTDKYNWKYSYNLIYSCFKYINIWWNLDKAVKYFEEYYIDKLLEKNNEFNLLDKSEIIKLKLLRS